MVGIITLSGFLISSLLSKMHPKPCFLSRKYFRITDRHLLDQRELWSKYRWLRESTYQNATSHGTSAGPWRPPTIPGGKPLIAGCAWVLGVRRALGGIKISAPQLLVWNYFIILTMDAAVHVRHGWLWALLQTLEGLLPTPGIPLSVCS